jgi:hypothetical protein
MSTISLITSGDEFKRRNGLGGKTRDFRLIRHNYQPLPRLPRWFDRARGRVHRRVAGLCTRCR